jgi:hypothetical protein
MKVKVNLPLKKRAGSCKSVILIVKCEDVREKDANRKANINIIINKSCHGRGVIRINNVNKVKAREV